MVKRWELTEVTKILPGLVKIPGVSFVSWQRWPREKLPRRPIPPLVPDLAVEVLSETNTPKEMERKLKQYFTAGVRWAWIIDPETRSAEAYTSPTDSVHVDQHGALDGGDVLPGFKVLLHQLFEMADRENPA